MVPFRPSSAKSTATESAQTKSDDDHHSSKPQDTATDYAADSAVMKTYGRAEIAFTKGEGRWLISEAGERYLDCAAVLR